MKFSNERKPGYISTVLAAVPTVILVGLLVKADAEDVASVLGLIFFFIAWLVIYIPLNKKQSEALTQSSQYSSKTLYLKKRGRVSESAIVLKRFYKGSAKFEPTKLEFSGMTFGGVTTGTIHVDEAHYESYGIRTDKFILCYNDTSAPIEKIVCEFDIPSNSPIAKYCIDKNTILLMPPEARKNMSYGDEAIISKAIEDDNQALLLRRIGEFEEQKQLSQSECKLIKAWIGGRI